MILSFMNDSFSEYFWPGIFPRNHKGFSTERMLKSSNSGISKDSKSFMFQNCLDLKIEKIS